MAYVDICETEVTGFFDVDYDAEDHAFVIGKVYLVKQEAGGADVEMSEDDLADFTFQLLKQGAEQLPRGWWHSHVNMGVFFSGTDDKTINKDFTNESFTLSIVFNKAKQYKASCMIWEPIPYGIVESPLRIDDLEMTIEFEHKEIPASLKKEVERKVKTRAIQTYSDDKPGFRLPKWISKKERKGVLATKIDGVTPKSLPKNKMEALERIDKLDLTRIWKPELKTFAYEDIATGDIWLDIWGVVEYNEYVSLKGGKDDTDRTEMQLDSLETERCVNCQYARTFHNEDVCLYELYPSDVSPRKGFIRGTELEDLDDDDGRGYD